MRNYVCLTFVIFVTASLGVAQKPENGAHSANVDATVQEQIARVTQARGSIHDYFAELAKLAELLSDDEQRLDSGRIALQIAHFRATHRSIEAQAMTEAILRTLVYDKRDILQAVVPHLDAEDEEFRHACRQLMHDSSGDIGRDEHDRPIFEDAAAYLAGDPPVPPVLVASIFSRDPRAALFTMVRGQLAQQRERASAIELAEYHVHDSLLRRRAGVRRPNVPPDESIKWLKELAGSELWWVRLYVVEMLDRHPQFRAQELMNPLMQDQNKLVRDTTRRLIANIERYGSDYRHR